MKDLDGEDAYSGFDNDRDLWRHLRIAGLAVVDREAAAVESARWLFEALGRVDLLRELP